MPQRVPFLATEHTPARFLARLPIDQLRRRAYQHAEVLFQPCSTAHLGTVANFVKKLERESSPRPLGVTVPRGKGSLC